MTGRADIVELGGRTPETGIPSVIESPPSWDRVMAPSTTARKTAAMRATSRYCNGQ